MKIGEKEYKPKIDNEVIFAIEEHFEGKYDSDILVLIGKDVQRFKVKEMAELIHFTVSDEFTWDEFKKTILPSQYVECCKEIIIDISKAFELDKTKKK